MNLTANGKVLVTATTNLSRQWTDTRQQWQDAKSMEFEQSYLADLQSHVDRAGLVLDEIERILMRIRKDCE